MDVALEVVIDCSNKSIRLTDEVGEHDKDKCTRENPPALSAERRHQQVEEENDT